MHSTSQHSTIQWSDHCAFNQPTQNQMVVRSSCIPPVNTVPHGGQIIVHSTSQHSTTWWSDHHAFYQSTQYHMVVRLKACEVRGMAQSSVQHQVTLSLSFPLSLCESLTILSLLCQRTQLPPVRLTAHEVRGMAQSSVRNPRLNIK